MEVTLLPNLPSFDSFSMKRYHRELTRALRPLIGPADQINEFSFERHFLSNRSKSRLLQRIDRWVVYPYLTRQLGVENIHVLDHSHAHLALCARPDARVIISCHDLMPLRDALGMTPVRSTTFNQSLLRFILKGLQRANAIITISQATRDDLIELAGISREKILVNYMGKNECFKPASEAQTRQERIELCQRFSLPPSAVVLMHLGTGSPAKNTSAILQAMAQVKIPNLVLLRVGAELSPSEKQLCQELQLRIAYAGNGVSDEQLAKMYRAADLFVFPSLWEGFGWPPLEAMGCGTPVVCSTIPSLRELVQDGQSGLMVEPNDTSALAAAITNLIENNQTRQRLVENGLKRAEQFTWSNNAAAVLELYNAIFNR